MIFVYLCEVKVLIVRFSSIGDIVLTSPVVRAMKNQFPDWELHYLTKQQFSSILTPNPHISKLYTIEKSIDEVMAELKSEKYDHLLDLHHNIRTASLSSKLGIPSSKFRKLNLKKWLRVNMKMDVLPKLHVVDRYFEAAEKLGVRNDMGTGDFYIGDSNHVNVQSKFGLTPKNYIAVAIGAQFNTKRMPAELLVKILKDVNKPIIILGGPTDVDLAAEIVSSGISDLINAVGELSIQESASVIQQAAKLLTNDTGMMHIGACLDTEIVSVWGNTVPELGMYPYYPSQEEKYSIHEVKNLGCRPCSKIGYAKCPKGHFKCMMDQDVNEIRQALNK